MTGVDVDREARVEPVFRSFLDKFSRIDPERVSGPPTSSNGASSCHVFWDIAPEPLREVSATIEVIEPPTVEKLYFWALQVNVQNGVQQSGGAHFGLQYHPSHPGGGAVNWGGYHNGGGELSGSVSALPSALDNINTRDYRWYPNRRYRYRVSASPERGWRGSITDLESGSETVVRDLWVDGDSLINPMVWTEAFADCDDPPAAVRWTDLSAVTTAGQEITAASVHINYQSHADGGCTNTDIAFDGQGVVQRTSTVRSAQTGSRLPVA